MPLNPTGFRIDDETMTILEAKRKSWGMNKSAFVRLAIRQMPDNPQAIEGRQNDDAPDGAEAG
jgi:hypothetical protein